MTKVFLFRSLQETWQFIHTVENSIFWDKQIALANILLFVYPFSYIEKEDVMSTKLKIFAVLGLAAALGAGGYWYYENHKQSGELKLYGNVDIRQVELAFLWPERIKEVLVEEGDVVKKNQVLATQDTDTLLLQIQQAKAAVNASYQTYLIQKNGSRPEEIAQAKANVDTAQSKLALSQKDLERVKEIFRATKGQGISQQNLDQAEAQVEYKYLTGDERVQRLAFLRDKWESDHKSELNWVKIEAEKRGEAKGGRKKQKQIVKELLKAEVQDEIIIKTTQISKEELEKMKEEVKN